MRIVFVAAIAALSVGLSIPAPALAVPVGTSWVEGTLVHISTANVKIKDDKTGKALSFLLVPHFDQVFAENGKTTYQMKSLHPGQLVKVFYDQKALGLRHADRILVLNRVQRPVKQQKG